MECIIPTSSISRLRKYDIDLYGCFVCYYKEKILEQKKLQNKLYPKKTGKSIVYTPRPLLE